MGAYGNTVERLCQKIQFTIEIEEKQQLPFIDVLVQRNDDNLTQHQCT